MLNLYNVVVVTDCGNCEMQVVAESVTSAAKEARARVIDDGIDYGCTRAEIYGAIVEAISYDL